MRRLALAALALSGCAQVLGLEEMGPLPVDAAWPDAARACNALLDAGPGCGEMVVVRPACFCIDAYESSGVAAGTAVAAPGVAPSVEVTWEEASAACVAAGKRLCTDEEWTAACAGTGARVYPYGDAYASDACNDHSGALAETGSFVGCEGAEDGIFDLSGNVWEWTATCAGATCNVRGGSFATDDPRCGARGSATTSDRQPNVGVRCCKDL